MKEAQFVGGAADLVLEQGPAEGPGLLRALETLQPLVSHTPGLRVLALVQLVDHLSVKEHQAR